MSPILYRSENHYVIAAGKGYEVYRGGLTHATRCAVIGFPGEAGLAKALAEVKRRERLISDEIIRDYYSGPPGSFTGD